MMVILSTKDGSKTVSFQDKEDSFKAKKCMKDLFFMGKRMEKALPFSILKSKIQVYG